MEFDKHTRTHTHTHTHTYTKHTHTHTHTRTHTHTHTHRRWSTDICSSSLFRLWLYCRLCSCSHDGRWGVWLGSPSYCPYDALHMSESCHTWMSHVTHEWVMPHIRFGHVARTKEACTRKHDSCHAHESVMANAHFFFPHAHFGRSTAMPDSWLIHDSFMTPSRNMPPSCVWHDSFHACLLRTCGMTLSMTSDPHKVCCICRV